jgi:hypothetical protein
VLEITPGKWVAILNLTALIEENWAVRHSQSEVCHVTTIIMCLNGTYSKLHQAKHLSDNFPTQNYIKQGADFLANAFSNFALEDSFENVAQLKYFGMTITYQHLKL